jgi:cysteinyl-tRNA synthetase
MSILLYNTLTKTKEVFQPRDHQCVSIYMIRRWFVYRGYNVRMVQNFTDIDDKIIRKAAEEGVDPKEVAAKYSAGYLADWERLGIMPVEFIKVTENMKSIVDLVSRLVDTGHAYVIPNGDVYFSVASFPEYGKLSRRDPAEMEAGARIEVDDAKHSPMDFALWKANRPGEPSWPSPWGPGRPGWHIECSALSMKALGEGFDIHAGGIDLIFPGSKFANYWMHWGSVNTGGEKMSKSLGNYFTIDDILEKFSTAILRMYLLTTHYRSPIDYAPERLEETGRSYARIVNALSAAGQLAHGAGLPDEEIVARFEAAMDDDFNTAQALGVVFDAVTALNRELSATAPDHTVVRNLAETIKSLVANFGIELTDAAAESAPDALVDDLITAAISWREAARKIKQYALSDMIRDDLKQLGIILEDRAQSTTWRRA